MATNQNDYFLSACAGSHPPTILGTNNDHYIMLPYLPDKRLRRPELKTHMKNIFIFIMTLCSFPVYSQIPVFETYSRFEKEVLLAENDTAYLYNFWATWCKPCVEELPYFVELSNTYKNEKVKVIFVSLDSKKNTDKLKSFVDKHLMNQTVINLTDHKYNDWIDKVDVTWSGSIPASLFKKGKLFGFHEKQFDDFNDLHVEWLHFLKK